MSYPAIPNPPDADGLPRDLYGQCLFAFVLQTDVTVTLTDDQLELASYAGVRLSGLQYDKATAGLVYAQIDRARTLIGDSLRRRAALAAAGVAPQVPPAAPDASIGPGGSRVPLSPLPVTRPPSGGLALPDPDLSRVRADIAF